MSDFIEQQGVGYLAHLLGRLQDEFLKGFAVWYPEANVRAPTRSHSTMHLLYEHGPLGVTEVAKRLRQSHPLVIDWVKQLTGLGFVEANRDPSDGRRTVLSLTPAGRSEFERQQEARLVSAAAFKQLLRDADAKDVFAALWRMESECRRRSFTDRLRAEAAKIASEQ